MTLYTISRICLLLLITISLFHYSCADKEHKEIGFSMPGIETRISRVLISRNSYEGAIIKILGKVSKIAVTEGDSEQLTTTNFEITDPKGNYINVLAKGNPELKDDDVIILSGTYSSPENIIYMLEFEIVKPSFE